MKPTIKTTAEQAMDIHNAKHTFDEVKEKELQKQKWLPVDEEVAFLKKIIPTSWLDPRLELWMHKKNLTHVDFQDVMLLLKKEVDDRIKALEGK